MESKQQWDSLEGDKVVMHKRRRKSLFEKWKGYLGRLKTSKMIKEIR